MVSYVKMSELTGDKQYYRRALALAIVMRDAGTLAPADRWMLEESGAAASVTQVFVLYKRDDEQRVAVLVRALEREGLSVWWDRGIPGGESWRLGIQAALEEANCVIVVWSHHSVGPSGDFVRDEAARAKRRGILVPVRVDDVDVPLGFGEVQSIDLTRWKGRRRDPGLPGCRGRCQREAGRPARAGRDGAENASDEAPCIRRRSRCRPLDRGGDLD